MNIWSWFLHGDSSHPIRHGWGEGRAFETCISDPLHEHCHLSPFQSHNFLRPSGHWLCHFCPPNYCQPLLFLLSYSLTFCLGIMIKSFFLLTSPTPTHSHAHTHIIISKPVWSPPFLIPPCLSPFPSYLYLFTATAWKDPCLLSVPSFPSEQIWYSQGTASMHSHGLQGYVQIPYLHVSQLGEFYPQRISDYVWGNFGCRTRGGDQRHLLVSRYQRCC